MLTERDICCLCCLIPDCKEAADTNGCWDVPSLSLGAWLQGPGLPTLRSHGHYSLPAGDPSYRPHRPSLEEVLGLEGTGWGEPSLAGCEQGLSRLRPCGVPFPLPSSPLTCGRQDSRPVSLRWH